MCAIAAPETLHTNRLALRPLVVGDAPAIARLSGDLEVSRMLTSVPHPNPVVAVEGWLLMLESRAPLGRDLIFAIEAGEEGLVGVTGAVTRPAGGAATIGYWVGKPYWGRGYASEAVRALVARLFDARAARTIEASHYIDNPASGRVLEKAGFQPTGVVEQRFSLARGASAPVRIMQRHDAAALL